MNPEFIEQERLKRKRAAVFTWFSLDVLFGREGVNLKVLERQSKLGVTLSVIEIAAARDLRISIPESEGYELTSSIGDEFFEGDMRLFIYGVVKRGSGFNILTDLEGELDNPDVRRMLKEDPSGVSVV